MLSTCLALSIWLQERDPSDSTTIHPFVDGAFVYTSFFLWKYLWRYLAWYTPVTSRIAIYEWACTHNTRQTNSVALHATRNAT